MKKLISITLVFIVAIFFYACKKDSVSQKDIVSKNFTGTYYCDYSGPQGHYGSYGPYGAPFKDTINIIINGNNASIKTTETYEYVYDESYNVIVHRRSDLSGILNAKKDTIFINQCTLCYFDNEDVGTGSYFTFFNGKLKGVIIGKYGASVNGHYSYIEK